MNKKALLIAVMGAMIGAAMIGAVLIAMPIGLIWPMPISVGFYEEILAVRIGTKLLQKISRL